MSGTDQDVDVARRIGQFRQLDQAATKAAESVERLERALARLASTIAATPKETEATSGPASSHRTPHNSPAGAFPGLSMDSTLAGPQQALTRSIDE